MQIKTTKSYHLTMVRIAIIKKSTRIRQNRLKNEAIKTDKEGHYLMTEGSIQEEDITLINIYALNIGAPRYIRQTLTDTEGESGGNIIVADF